MKRRASRGSEGVTQNRHQKLNGTVTGLTHDRRVDCVSTVTPVRFEIPARAASRSSKLIPIKGRHLPNQIAELTGDRVAQLGARDLASPHAQSLRPKQQL